MSLKNYKKQNAGSGPDIDHPEHGIYNMRLLGESNESIAVLQGETMIESPDPDTGLSTYENMPSTTIKKEQANTKALVEFFINSLHLCADTFEAVQPALQRSLQVFALRIVHDQNTAGTDEFMRLLDRSCQ